MAMAENEEKIEEEEEEEEEEDGTVAIEVTTPIPRAQELQEESCSCVSTFDIQSWDLPLLLQSSSLIITAQRSRLVQQSKYFCALLDGNFSESSLEKISIGWDPQIFLQILQSIFGCSVHIEPDNFLLLIEGALFFGVDALLSACEDWFRRVCSETGLFSHLLSLEYLLGTWNYSKEKCVGFIQMECIACVARNFAHVVKSSLFCKVPFDMLLACTEHPDLTVYSEKQLCEALIEWISGNTESSSDVSFTLLRKVRSSLLPLSFASGLRRFYSEIGNEAVDAILNTASKLKDLTSLNQFKIRITNYSKKLLLSGCPQMSENLLLISLLKPNTSLSLIKQILNSSSSFMRHSFKSLDNKFVSFPNMLEIDISGCHQLDAHCTISFLSRAFPSLAILRASHCSQFRVQDLNFLINSCPTLHEVDFSRGFDAGDFLWSGHGRENVLVIAADVVDNRCVAWLSKLTLEGHNDLNDRHFSELSNLTEMLSYLNITSCSGLSDLAIAAFLRKCLSIHSLLLCYTSFGKESVKVLCSDDCQNPIGCPTIASRLQRLHLDGCKEIFPGVDEFAMSHLLSHMTMIKEVSLRGTSLTDEAISNFTVSSLERLDVSDTKVTSDDVIKNLLASLKHLQGLELRCCLGDLTIHCFEVPQNLMLTALRLEWVCKWMTNDHLSLLTSTFRSLTELSLSGCQLLDSYSQDIISAGWPGLTVLHLEECGILSKNGVSSLLSCKGLEDLLLRHNGGGIPKTFITDAASELLQLRILALDLCDACDGGFDSPSHTFLRTVKMSRCRKQKLSFGLKAEIVKPVHRETIILQWNGNTDLQTSIVKERI
ncbi:ubiquitin-protein ligase isoform X4 [Carex rostrata]